ncbi:MAG: sigma 54-interacting transcriptional regulator [Nitrospirae bacterium]|nr:sigma 54-interacting transcriptional regulator [Candidatus Manganitrophaceae bacterium]
MEQQSPWTTCLLTRMLILHLERIGKADGLDYQEILAGDNQLNRIADPRAFLLKHTNWVPHHVLKNLIITAENATGTKEITYLAAKSYYQSGPGPSLLEIIAKLQQNNMEQALNCSNLWATGFANYFKLQCLPPSGVGAGATLLSQFAPYVEPIVGNYGFIRGNYEGMTTLFDDIAEAQCIEELSQLKLETLCREFSKYRIERQDARLSIVDTTTQKEVAAARQVFLKTELLPALADDPRQIEGLILPPRGGEVRLLLPQIEDDPERWRKEHSAYQIVHGGMLQAGKQTFTLREGAYFNAPYSRYRFTWKSRSGRKNASETITDCSEIIPLLFNHVRELRETHRQLLHYTMENKALAQANEELKGEIRREYDFHGIIGKSPKMLKLFEQVELIAPVDSTILVLGETGTGKEALAKAIHQCSLRRDQRFYALNCAALSESLLEAELFGHEKGAFTGALSLKKGIFETASGGTLFLDEVGEISPTLQAKLLRVLEEREIQRVGGRDTIPIDVRVISATNRDLQRQVHAEKFRSDLYYRLHVISLVIPPLRERLDDLPLLVDHFLEFFSKKCKKPKPAMTRETVTFLTRYAWPGNIRQLKNVIERAVVLDRDQVINPDDIILPEGEAPQKGVGVPQPFHEALEQYKRSVIEEALQKTGGNQTKAAALLGLQRTYLARLIRTFRISS